MKYLYSFCSNVPGYTCQGNASASLVQQGGGNTCNQGFGQAETARLTPMADPESGFVLEISGGSLCSSAGNPVVPFSVFNVACAPGQTAVIGSSLTATSCSVVYNLRAAAGCPAYKSNVLRKLGVGWIVFLAALVGVALYLTVGIIYKRRVYGASGIEAIPNIDTWRAVGRAVSCGRKSAAGDGDVYVQAMDDDGPSYTGAA
jgi:hypothetical protein